MPAGVGASYRSLGGDLAEDVYRSTTIAHEQGQHHQGATTGHSVLESVKKAFSFAAPRVSELGGLGGRKKDPLIYEDRRETVSIVSR